MGFFDSLFGTTPGVITGARARELVAAGATLLDVRTPGEFSGGHVSGAQNIPVETLPAGASKVSKDKPVVVYCRSGARSARAASALREVGFTEVYDLGGIGNW
jgi:phage shock protein E